MPAVLVTQIESKFMPLINFTKDVCLPPFYTLISKVISQAYYTLPVSCDIFQKTWEHIGYFTKNVTDNMTWENATSPCLQEIPFSETVETIKTPTENFAMTSLYLGMAAWGGIAHLIHSILLAKKPEFQENFSRFLSWTLASGIMFSVAAYAGEDLVEISKVAAFTLGTGLLFTKVCIPVTTFALNFLKWNTPVVSFNSSTKKPLVQRIK